MKTENSYKVSVLVLGFSAITVQIIFLREFLTVFNGNELVIGVILANWMLLTGLGSFLGKFSEKIKNSAAAVITIHLLMGLLPFIIVFLIKYLKNIIFPPGSMIGLIQVLYGSFIVMAPFCIISGFLFSLLCSIVSKHFKTNKISYIYALEAVGSITGGLLFNLILIYFFSVFQSLIILLFINFIISLIICFLSKLKITGYIFIILACSLAFLCIYYDFDRITAEFLFQTKNIVVNKDTPYGNLVITKTEEQINFFEDGILLFSSGSPQQNEEDIHYALIQRTKYENVLLISGGITGTLKEIQKYKPACIDYIEINPWLLYYAGKYAGFMPDSNVNLIT
ncbi:MAG: hypothetical protein HY738_17290, partial [Bacteroidia bacterium]|nr:hypothetical protein [Bacteroidia bacterium]